METEKRKFCRLTQRGVHNGRLHPKHGCIACAAAKQKRLYVPVEEFQMKRLAKLQSQRKVG